MDHGAAAVDPAPGSRLDQLADSLLASLTLEEKLGQLFMVGFTGTSPDAGIEEWLRRCYLGNVVLFAPNLVDPEQAWQLTNALQDLARLPLFIAADQEGGIVVRLTRGFTVFPGNMALGATRDPGLARQAAAIMAREMRAVGIQFNLAPVLDVNNNPQNPVIGVRSYGEDPALVAELGVAQIQGFQHPGPGPGYDGVVACAKHFPGHGDTAVDSHLALPRIDHDRERLAQVELLPFRRAIAAGVGAIMTAHLSVPAFEPNAHLPATLSPRVITGLLREELGFDGIVITDSLGMRGVSARYNMVEASLLALEAGCDLLCASSHTYYGTFVYDAILAAVKAGRLPEARVDRSVRRILRAKLQFGIISPDSLEELPRKHQARPASRLSSSRLAAVGSPTHLAVAQEVARRSITAVKGPPQLPGGIHRVVVIEFSAEAQTGVEDLALERGIPATSPVCPGLPAAPAAPSLGPAPVDGRVGPAPPPTRLGQALALALAQAAHCPAAAEVQPGASPDASSHPPAVYLVVLPLNPEASRRRHLLSALTQTGPAQTVPVVATLDALRNPGQAQLIEELAAAGFQVYVVSLRNPYELCALPHATTFLVAYSPRPVSLAAAAEVLAGLAPPAGRLPVSIPGLLV
ncbi:MAG TPA: beta-N-acetylhexosaminidase [Firmicutes bacterium]|nr:beta-N-acetylhexosaminidase [Bacillota bacterium]